MYARSIFAYLLVTVWCWWNVPAYGQQRRPYYEDLSRLRPIIINEGSSDSVKTRPWIEATHTVNKSVDAMLDSINSFYRRHGTANGFTIQVYSGQKKQEALNAARLVQESVSDLKPDVEFIQPKFRVVAGHYFSRVEAQRHWFILHKTFPDAIIIPLKFELGK